MNNTKRLKISVISIGCKDGHFLDGEAEKLRAEGFDLEVLGYDYSELDGDVLAFDSFIRDVASSDIVFIKVHGDVSYFKKFDKLKETLENKSVSALLTCTEYDVMEEYRYLFRHPDEEYDLLRRLVLVEGDNNHRAVLIWILNTLGGQDIEIPELEIPMGQGVYVPGEETLNLAEGIEKLDKSRPTIGVLFHHKFWLTSNTVALDELIRRLEEKGASVLPVFFSSYPKEFNDSIGIKGILDEYIMKDGRSVLDAIVMTAGFSQTLLADPGSGTQVSEDNFFERLGIPIIQSMMLFNTAKRWRDSPFGLDGFDIATSVVNPEFDGQIITVPFATQEKTEDGSYKFFSLEERAKRTADIAYLWANLRHKQRKEKKVAILIYMYPPRQDLAGGASGLDTFASTAELLKRMDAEGYELDWVPENGKELVNRLLDGVTNDDDWRSEQAILEAAVDTVSKEQYEIWFDRISENAKRNLIEGWGDPPGKAHVIDGKVLLPGIMNGNIFIGFQPDRGKTIAESYHNAELSMPHQYLAFYRWLRYDFGADAVVHVGTHGSLEWLPGKSVGLSKDCYPDVVLDSLPNIYPYIIDNPGEGIQAKRRIYAVVTTYMIPSMARAGSYEDFAELEAMVQSFMNAQSYNEKENSDIILDSIDSKMRDMSLFSDLGISEDHTVDDLKEKMDDLYDYILEVKDALINDGLHILGDVPSGDRMAEMIYSLTRYDNGDIPSLRIALAKAMGHDLNDLINDFSGRTEEGRLKGQVVDEIDERMSDIIEKLLSEDCRSDVCTDIVKREYPDSNDDLLRSVEFICNELYPNICLMDEELSQIISGLDGNYVPPGPSGCPTRGRAQILPTGRNFYSIDPDGVPWHSSWEVGMKMADNMVERYVEEKGEYPRSIGVVVWATDVMRTGGDDVAYVLRLMGLRPVWTGYGGRVKGLDIIPLQELGRPRLDVTLRVSGLFRDTFPNIMDLIDDGVRMIADLDESEEDNYLAANLRMEMLEAIEKGIPHDEARRSASIRIFGDAPGQYGCGVNTLIMNGKWKDVKDLGDIYQHTGCYVYGRGLEGQGRPDLFKKRLQKMKITVKNHSNREVDMFDMDDDYDYLGGFTAAVRVESGEKPESYMGDSSDTVNLKLRSVSEECRFIFRSKLNNPKWLDGLKQHGFRGAQELSSLFDYVIAWDATSDIIEDWMYEDLSKNFILDEDTREWIKDENPYAMMAMLSRLQEAISRGMWDPSDKMRQQLKDIYLEFEERIEELSD